MSPDPRLAWLPAASSYYRCPLDDCEYQEHGVFVALVRGPDGRQRATWACAEHLPLYVEAALNHLRLRPPPDL